MALFVGHVIKKWWASLDLFEAEKRLNMRECLSLRLSLNRRIGERNLSFHRISFWVKFENARPEKWTAEHFEMFWNDLKGFMLRNPARLEWIVKD